MKEYFQSFTKSRSRVILIIPLLLSAFIHIWNPIGFPSPHHDEDTHYLPRALMFMKYADPQKQHPGVYHHPFFAQIFLGTIFKAIGYPQAFITTGNSDIETIHLIYTIPRIIMGLLALVDTLLTYKISDVCYGRKVAFISAILFAVMPTTWLLRRVLLDNLLLPFLLSSLLLAIFVIKSEHKAFPKIKTSQINIIFLMTSGILLGLAIFTKIPAFTIIPLFIYLIIPRISNKKMIVLWLVPVILIPLIWPLHAVSLNHFDLWIEGVLWQTDRIDQPLSASMLRFFEIDPVLFTLGIAGLAYAILRKDFFLLLWVIPFLIFTEIINFVSLFHLVFLLPVLCIAGAKLIFSMCNRIRQRRAQFIVSISSVAAITIFGFTSSLILITMNLSDTLFQAASFTNNYLPKVDGDGSNLDNKVTVIGPVRYFWIPRDVYGKSDHYYESWEYSALPIKTKKILFIVPTGDITKSLSGKGEQSEWLRYLYNITHTVAVFLPNSEFVPISDKYFPYTSLKESRLSQKIEIRANY